MRLRARTDSNQKAIVAALRKVGCQVADLSPLGNGVPDLLVSFRSGTRRELALMEIKTERGHATAAQRAFEAQGWMVYIVRSVDDALRIIGQ